MKKQPAEGKSAGRFLHIGCILACFGIRAGFVLEFAPRHVAPCAGAWIEINEKYYIADHGIVAPCAGAWIEIG